MKTMKAQTGDIREATRAYEQWMRARIPVVESALIEKHRQMKDDAFLFFRGTYYRWAQLWPMVCRDLATAPKVLAIGDLHVGSFGTWRDPEGRLCWGIDDFDEAYPLPYTTDLVRLAASAKMMIDAQHLDMKSRRACESILEGYECTLREGGHPIVLAENETDLERLGIQALKSPPDFWEKLQQHPPVRQGQCPRDAKRAIEETLPRPDVRYKLVRRQAGLGSMGQPRFVAIAEWEGGCIAREAKAYLPSACVWVRHRGQDRTCYYQKLITAAKRSRDSYQKVIGKWIIRRLSPDSNPIELADLPARRDERLLLYAMAQETANAHLARPDARQRILRDLRGRPTNWLRRAAKAMAKNMKRDWKEYAGT